MSQIYSFPQAIFVKMFRRWAAARAVDVDRRAAMADVYRGPGSAMMAAVACDSLFALVEAHLERELTPECCCSRALTADEAALLGLLYHAGNASGVTADAAMPHGLSGAICWAALAARRELGLSSAAHRPPPLADPLHCPFRQRAESVDRRSLN
ncbi:MAG: hypothetical protein J0I69_07765 [Altererythrobacter sp.]|nr:hypothetical protein [Altererythrobacter sp.]